MSKTLKQIVDEGRLLLAKIEAQQGELTETDEILLIVNGTEAANKADGIGEFKRLAKMYIADYKDRAKEFTANARRLERACDFMDAYLGDYLRTLNDGKLSGDMHEFSVSDSAGALVIENEALIPNSYKKQIVTTELDREAIKTDLKLGVPVPGCRIQINPVIRQRLVKKLN